MDTYVIRCEFGNQDELWVEHFRRAESEEQAVQAVKKECDHLYMFVREYENRRFFIMETMIARREVS
tara:strand:+ start:965 stop:1165 length:201 start_codon:yes stop_codon:yes gene_type:complete